MKRKIFLIVFFTVTAFTICAQSTDYENTQGKETGDLFAPYLKSFCKQEKMSCDSLARLIFKDVKQIAVDTSFMPFFLSSNKHITGNWTYFTAKTALIYEMGKVGTDKVLLLYSKQHPERILVSKSSEWRIAIIDTKLKLIDDKPFLTTWKYSNEGIAMWDMIYTDMEVKGSAVAVKIRYVHTGSGGGHDQEFTAKTNFVKGKMESIVVKQTKDETGK